MRSGEGGNNFERFHFDAVNSGILLGNVKYTKVFGEMGVGVGVGVGVGI